MQMLKKIAKELDRMGYESTIREFPRKGEMVQGISCRKKGSEKTGFTSVFFEPDIEKMIERGISIPEICRLITAQYNEQPEEFDKMLHDREYVLDHVEYFLLPEGMRDEMQGYPHFMWLDFPVAYQVILKKTSHGKISTILSDQNLEALKIERKELHASADFNTAQRYSEMQDIADTIREALQHPEDFPCPEGTEPIVAIRLGDNADAAAILTVKNRLEELAAESTAGLILSPYSTDYWRIDTLDNFHFERIPDMKKREFAEGNVVAQFQKSLENWNKELPTDKRLGTRVYQLRPDGSVRSSDGRSWKKI